MKVKLGDIADSFDMLSTFMNSFSFTLRLSYDLGKTLKSCKEEVVTYNELVEKFRKQFTVKNSEGKEIIDPDKFDAFKQEIKDLRDKEIDVWGLKPVTIKTIEDAIILAHKQQKPDDKDFVPMVPPALLAYLDWLIVMDEEESSAAAA